eukprot:9139867-Pyramimonas_sp.AAC.1
MSTRATVEKHIPKECLHLEVPTWLNYLRVYGCFCERCRPSPPPSSSSPSPPFGANFAGGAA